MEIKKMCNKISPLKSYHGTVDQVNFGEVTDKTLWGSPF